MLSLLTFGPVCQFFLQALRKVKDFAEVLFDKFIRILTWQLCMQLSISRPMSKSSHKLKLKFKQDEVRLEKEHEVEGRRCVN